MSEQTHQNSKNTPWNDKKQKHSSSSTPLNKKGKKGGGVSTLTPLLRHFQGLYLTVEIKNGRSYCGVLVSSDHLMNLVLQKRISMQGTISNNRRDTASSSTTGPKSTDPTRDDVPSSQQLSPFASSPWKEELSYEEYDMIHIRGSSIRYIHFPDRTDIPKLLKQGKERERLASEKYKRRSMKPKAR